MHRQKRQLRHREEQKDRAVEELPILMVACREITSGDKGCNVVTSSLLRSCSISPRFAMFASSQDHTSSSTSSL